MSKKLLVLLFLLMVVNLYSGYQVGDTVDNFSFKASTGDDPVEITLYDLIDDGKVVWLDFSATWCGPCRLEAPVLEKSWEQFSKEDGPLFICAGISDINGWNNLNGSGWRDDFSIPLTYWLSTADELCEYSDQFNNTGGIPYNVVIGKDYKVIYSDSGFSSNVHHLIHSIIEDELEVDLEAPANFVAQLAGNDVEMSWSPIENNLLEYKVYRDDELIASLPAETLSYTDISPEIGLHDYCVKGYMDYYGGIYSNSSEVETIMVGYLNEGWLNYGEVWDTDMSYGATDEYWVAMDFDLDELFGTEVKVTKIKASGKLPVDCTWQIVRYTDQPTDEILEGLEGELTLQSNYQEVVVDVENDGEISGKVAVVLRVGESTTNGNRIACMTDAIAGEHAWIKCDNGMPNWTKLNEYYDYAWNIQAYVVAESGIETELIPTGVELYQNHPNPFNPNTSFEYFIPSIMDIKIEVFNCRGEVVKEEISRGRDRGSYTFNFDGIGLHSGVYFYKLTTPMGSVSKRMVLLK